LSLSAQQTQPPRTADKRPDFNGIWQAMNSANWDLEAHPARPSLILELGAIGGTPAGQSVVESGSIPYQPAALAKKKENFHDIERDVFVRGEWQYFARHRQVHGDDQPENVCVTLRLDF
jgi:hypothetical protein